MRNSLLFLVASVVTSSFAQTYTLSGCHQHGNVEYCYLPGGSEVPFRTLSSSAVAAVTTGPASASATATPTSIPASVTGCHAHGTSQYCLASGTEWLISGAPTITPLPTAYTGCHLHDGKPMCIAPDGTEVGIELEVAEVASGTATATSTSSATSGQSCHFHAGVEHCVSDGESEYDTTESCDIVVREYNIGLRVGLLFIILITSAIAVFSPIILTKFTKISLNSMVFIILKQFGTGIIISTAFVHLLTHAELMFGNSCLGTLEYEATTTSIAMAGIFLSFIIEFIGQRLVANRAARSASKTPSIVTENERSFSKNVVEVEGGPPGAKTTNNTTLADLGHAHAHTARSGSEEGDEHFSVAVMEAGIIFHSILIGITLVVAGDSYFITLFIVILFHQMFEGLALGTRIAALPADSSSTSISWLSKFIMASLFAVITPIGMGIGTGVLHSFNGNDPKTIVAIGTLDALSAGILIWVGIVGMWAHDWMGGSMKDVSLVRVCVGITSLVFGMVIMSVLGKWA